MSTAAHDLLDAATLEEWLSRGEDCRLLDVRTAEEFESVRIPGSHNVPLDALVGHADHLERSLKVPVVVVCRSGNRAVQASQTLAAAGMSKLHVLDGGIRAWDDGQRAVERGQQRWAMDRQVRLVAGLLVLSGIAGSVFVPKMKYFAGAIGAGLTFSGISNTCGLARVLSMLPYNRGPRADVDAAVRELTAQPA